MAYRKGLSVRAVDKQRFIDAALAIANKAREQLGYPPVDHIYKGHPTEFDSCPIVRTIYDDDIGEDDVLVEVFENQIRLLDHRKPLAEARIVIPQTRQSRAFVENFDKGRMPEFDIGDDRDMPEFDK